MRRPARVVAWVLPFMLTGCFHWIHRSKVPPVAPSIALPTPPPELVSVALSPEAMTIPLEPIQPDLTIPIYPEETAKRHIRHRKQADKSAPDVSDEIPAVSAIGQLSMGDPADTQRETAELIASTERGLDAISHNLNNDQQKTAVHVREFLKQAKAALASGDVDGAHTLAAKAKVLLDELRG